jgi:DNA-binding transcriptional LysR family regulator
MLSPDAPDLVALDILVSVGELGSLGRAASRHRISQPAVSQRMAALERRVGLKLLRRDPSGTRLTPAGARLVVAAGRVLSEVRAFVAEAATLSAERSGRLRLAASLTVAEHLLPAWLAATERDLAAASISLEMTNSARVMELVINGQVDLGFVENAQSPVAGLETIELLSDRLVVVVGPRHPWASRPSPVRPEELAEAELVVREKGSGTREVLESAMGPWGGVRTRLELGSPAAIISAIARGEAPGVLSTLAAAASIAAGLVVQVEVDGVELVRTIRAVRALDQPLSELAVKLLAAARRNTLPPPSRS